MKARLLCAFVALLLLATQASARQYKSRVFNDSEQELSASEANNIAALEEAFASYQDDYQIASAGQYLAREMVANGQYEKAALYYYKALQSGGQSNSGSTPQQQTLDPLVLKQLRIELAQVLLTLKREQEVIALFKDELLQPPQGSIAELLLVARAHLALQQFHQVVMGLQSVTDDLTALSNTQLQQVSALFYQANALPLVVKVLTEMRQRSPEDVDIARQLTGLHIRLEQFQQALDLWSLVYAQDLLAGSADNKTQPATDTFTQDILLLADLYHRQKAPEKAARLLQQAMEDGRIPATPEHSFRLFEFWYQAKEMSNAKTALWQSIQHSHNLQHALMLAELLQQSQQWQQLENLILLGCNTVLPDNFAGRINLFYGIALHKLGKHEDARRAFINASLVSGVKTQAREWLAFTGAAPASIEESETLWGPCLPEDPDIELPKNLRQPQGDSSPEMQTQTLNENSPEQQATSEPLAITVLPATRLYAGRLTTTAQNLQRDIKTKTYTLLKNLMRSGGRVDGEMHLLFSFDDAPGSSHGDGDAEVKLNVGFPYSGVPSTRAGFKIIKQPKRNALLRHYQGPAAELEAQWQWLVQQALQQGLTPTGAATMVFVSDTSGTDQLDVQLQLIVE